MARHRRLPRDRPGAESRALRRGARVGVVDQAPDRDQTETVVGIDEDDPVRRRSRARPAGPRHGRQGGGERHGRPERTLSFGNRVACQRLACRHRARQRVLCRASCGRRADAGLAVPLLRRGGVRLPRSRSPGRPHDARSRSDPRPAARRLVARSRGRGARLLGGARRRDPGGARGAARAAPSRSLLPRRLGRTARARAGRRGGRDVSRALPVSPGLGRRFRDPRRRRAGGGARIAPRHCVGRAAGNCPPLHGAALVCAGGVVRRRCSHLRGRQCRGRAEARTPHRGHGTCGRSCSPGSAARLPRALPCRPGGAPVLSRGAGARSLSAGGAVCHE